MACGHIVWMYGRRSLLMHVKAKQMAFGGLILAVTVVCMALGSVIETNTLFCWQQRHFCRDCYSVSSAFVQGSLLSGSNFIRIPGYAEQILCNYICCDGILYSWNWSSLDISWQKRPQMGHRMGIYWLEKYVIFNLVYLPCLFGFQLVAVSRKQCQINCFWQLWMLGR